MSLFSNLFGGEFGKGLVAGTAKGLEKVLLMTLKELKTMWIIL